MTGPTLVAHADWSLHPKKRWMAVAVRAGDTWHLSAPEPVGALDDLFPRLCNQAGGGPVLAGFDFPLGLPIAYARRAGIDAFPRFLKGLGGAAPFFRVCERADEISHERPFYPQRPGGTRQALLLEGLGVRTMDDLRRRCERATPNRPAACPLFWTLGGNQVGKAAITGWRDLIGPALADPALDVALWPFDGYLAHLHRPGRVVVAETYPAEFYRHLGVRFRGGEGKRSRAARQANAPALLAWARAAHKAGHAVVPNDALTAQLEGGFGTGPVGEDRFDAAVGMFGMLNLVLGMRPLPEPTDPQVRHVEGWILGQRTG